MKDITFAFKEAIALKNGYNSRQIASEIEMIADSLLRILATMMQ